MDFSYTPEQERRRREIIAFARATLNADAGERDRTQTFSMELWKACAAHGLCGLPVPTDHGGAGLDPLSCAIALEALGYGSEDNGLTFGIAAHVMSCVVPINAFGNEAQKRRHLPGLCGGDSVGALAMTEGESGSNPFAMKTEAVRDGAMWRLRGSKTFISNVAQAAVFVVFAKTDETAGFQGGITAFLVERGTPGLIAGPNLDKAGLRSVSCGDVTLNDARVGEDAVLGGVGTGGQVFANSMNWERVCLFAAHVGQMERLTERAIAFARVRMAKGAPISKNQAVSHTIADMKIRLEAARLLTYRAASQLGISRGVALEAAICKTFVSEALVQTALETMQIFGGRGYLTEPGVERAVRDALGSTIYSGTSEIQRNIIASWLGL